MSSLSTQAQEGKSPNPFGVVGAILAGGYILYNSWAFVAPAQFNAYWCDPMIALVYVGADEAVVEKASDRCVTARTFGFLGLVLATTATGTNYLDYDRHGRYQKW